MTRSSTVSTIPRRRLPRAEAPPLGVLSIHLDGAPCRVGCPFCYLGARAPQGDPRALPLPLLEEALARLDYAEVAVAVSEPVGASLAPLAAIVRAARARGRPVAVTTTAAALLGAPELVEGVARVNLSVDPRKGSVAPQVIAEVARRVRTREREIVLIASLVSPEFAARLLGLGQGRAAAPETDVQSKHPAQAGLLAAYLALEEVDKVALNGLKPPPPWCDRSFWLAAAAHLGPLLREHLDRRLFLDCYVAARILGLGDCPARPDLSPGPAFRSCVYQPAPDFVFASAEELVERLADFKAPAQCPFPIP